MNPTTKDVNLSKQKQTGIWWISEWSRSGVQERKPEPPFCRGVSALLWVPLCCLLLSAYLWGWEEPGQQRKLISLPRSLPKAHDSKWGLEHRLSGKQRAWPSADAALIHPSASRFIFPSHVSTIPRYFDSVTWSDPSFSNWGPWS